MEDMEKLHNLNSRRNRTSRVCLCRSNAERGALYFLTHASIVLYNKLRLTTQLSPKLLSSSEVSFGTPRRAAKRIWVIKCQPPFIQQKAKR